jgi:ribose 5-phosphate isomerase B
MRVAFGCDHGGYPFREPILEHLRAAGHTVVDCGAYSFEPTDDYPDFTFAAGEAVRRGDADRAIVVCGSAVGAAIAANKLVGIRASIAHDTYSAHQGVEHDDMNVLALGARVIGPELALEIVDTFLRAQFSQGERHVRRIGKIKAVEKKELEVRNGG